MFSYMVSQINQSVDKVNVLLLAFNRPLITQKVLEAIAGYAPQRLYVAIDGPRAGHAGDAVNCPLVKQVVEAWEAAHPATRVIKLYRPANLGCGKAVSGAISWFFEQEEMGIVLEDDCLPGKSFFPFCELLLHHYRHEEQVMHIGGSNLLNGGRPVDSTYYFSKYPHIWGWASWRRAWQKYQFDMPRFEQLLQLPEFRHYYDSEVFIKTKSGEVDTWDSQWVYSVLVNRGLAILPKNNLVKNLGFDEHAGTHLVKKPKWYDDSITEIDVIYHPDAIVHNSAADDYVFRKAFRQGAVAKLKKFIKRLLFKKS